MREWKLRDTLMVLFMAVVVSVMYAQMVQSDRLYERVNRVISLLEEGARPWGGAARSSTASTDKLFVPEAELGGTAVLHYAAQPANLNPFTYKDYYGAIILGEGGVYETLLERDQHTLELTGRLAESWSISEDKLAITFKIKPEATWSDGQPITADDVMFSYRVLMIPTLDAQRMQTYFLDCERVEAVDAKTVRFFWKKPYFKSVETAGGLTVVPQHIHDPEGLLDANPEELAKRINAWNFEWNGKVPVTGGPYVLESWDKAANRVVLRRNERYWGPMRPLQRLVFRFISNDTAALQSLKAEQLDVMWLTPEQWEKQTSEPQLLDKYEKRKYLTATAGYNYIGWNLRRPPFDDPKVRRAMSCAVPRQKIIEKVFYNLRELCNGPFPAASKQASPEVGQISFDLDQTRRLLAEAGFRDTDGDGFVDRDGKRLKFSLMMPAGSVQYEQIVSLFQDELSKVGVEMSVDPYEWSVFTTRLDERNFDACMLGWSGAVESDPFQVWHSSSAANKGSNHIGYHNPEVDRLIELARVEFDADKRNAMYHKVHELIFADQPYTFLFTGPSLMIHHKRLKNVQTTPIGTDMTQWWIPRSERRPGE